MVYFTSPISFIIVDSKGNIVATQTEEVQQFNVRNLPNGIYIVRTFLGVSLKMPILR
jgi:hypothetical protein